jgi:predicted rRNA methylase YqxC with S4 and FtsJ domains
MNELYNEFVKERLGNMGMLGARTVEIRLVYQHDKIVCNLSFISVKLISKRMQSTKQNMSRLME